MKRTSTISVRVAALGLMVALAAGLTSSATAGTLAHARKHKAKPKAISCKALIAPSLLTHEVTVDTGIAPVVNPATEINDTHQRGTLAGVPLRQCALYWGNADGTGNATAYGYCAGCQPPAIWWTAGTAVTTRAVQSALRRRERQRQFREPDRAPICEGAHPVARQRQPCVLGAEQREGRRHQPSVPDRQLPVRAQQRQARQARKPAHSLCLAAIAATREADRPGPAQPPPLLARMVQLGPLG
jgi:hypothetical protein